MVDLMAALHSHRKMSYRERVVAFRDRMIARRKRGKAAFAVIDAKTLKPYPVTYAYGVKNSRYAAGRHTGEDYACPTGSLALATTFGKVVFAGWGSGRWGSAYGNQVVVRTAGGKYDYAHNHLSKITCSVGDEVIPGTVLGLTGETGNVTGPHSHFETRRAGGSYGSDVHPINVRRSPK